MTDHSDVAVRPVTAQPIRRRARRVCYLGVSDQALGGVVLTDVEALIGRKFTGFRQNADTPPNWSSISAHSNGYTNNGRTFTYRAIQVKTSGTWAEVIAGTHDATLTTFSDAIVALPTKFNFGNPFYVCFHHEASIDSTPLGGPSGTAQQRIDAFRHVRNHFNGRGSLHENGGPIMLADVGWDRMFVGANGVGGPTAGQGVNDFDPDRGSSPAAAGFSYYGPTGSDVYNPLDAPGVLRYGTDAATLLEPLRDAAIARGKNYMIGEFGCNDGSTTQDHRNKADWIDSARRFIRGQGRHGPGRCIAVLTTVKASAENYNVDSSAESLAAWRRWGRDEYFR